MDISETSPSWRNDRCVVMDTFGDTRRKSIACAASIDECKGNIGSVPNYFHLRKLAANKVEKQASTAGGSNSSDSLRTSWPELTKSVKFQRRGNKSKLPDTTVIDQIVKESIRRRTEVKTLKDLLSNASKSDIANSVLTVQDNSKDTPLQATSYSYKTEGCNSVEERCVNNSGTMAGLEKCVKNTRQVCMSSCRNPKDVASIYNHTNESEKYTTCGDVRGVACEGGQIHDSYLDTTGTSRMFCDPSGRKMQLVFKHMQTTNLSQTNLQEQGITIGESGNALRTRRSSQRMKTLKEEKRRLREEEIRRRMLAPKGQAVRLVSQKMAEELLNGNPKSMSFSRYQTAAPAMNEKEFPTVEESRKPRMRINEGYSCAVQHVDVQERIPSHATQVKLKHEGSDSDDCVKISNADREVVEMINSVSVRNRKRKDPVQINLMNLIKAQPSRHNKGHVEKGSVSNMNSRTQKRDDLIRYSGNQLDASNPERKRGKKREVAKKKKISVLKSVILEERALRRQCQAFQEQSGSVDMQKEDGVTVDSSACINDTVLSTAEEIQSLSVSETGAVTGDNVRKDEGVNITEVLNLTESLKENLSLSTSCQGTTLSEAVSDGLESTEEMMCKVERGESNCTVVPSGLLPHGCMEELWRLPFHSRKFREYCDNFATVPLNSAVRLMLKDIVKFQDRLYHRDPVKAFAKRRYVLGFHEVMKYLHLKKLKLIIVAPDLEVVKEKGGIYDIISQLKEESTAQGLPCLFALSRRELGYLTFKKVGVSCIGICSYEGSERNFMDVMESLAGARTEYEQKTQRAITVPSDGATHKPDTSTDETTTLTNQVITSFLSKLTENSSGDSTSRLLSAIERAPSLE